MPLKMIQRIFAIVTLAFLMSNSFAQSPSGSNLLNAYRNFLNGTLHTQEACENQIGRDSATFFPQPDGTINGEGRITRDGISKIVLKIKIKTISLVDESKQLIRYEADMTNLTSGVTNSMVTVVKFNGTSSRVIDSSDETKKIVSNGVFVRSGKPTQTMVKCQNFSKTIDGSNQNTASNSDAVVEDRLSASRRAASIDVVSQALNYSIGANEDSSGEVFYAPINNSNGTCVYRLLTPGAIQRPDLLGALMNMAIIGNAPRQVDINKGNRDGVAIYEKRLDGELYYVVNVDGIPGEFTCSSRRCNSARLIRAWNLIFSKCKTTARAF